jgi:succinate-acetate transporter protein
MVRRRQNFGEWLARATIKGVVGLLIALVVAYVAYGIVVDALTSAIPVGG